ncbi:PREDICTED: triggering receptor expressed on myeloid cells 1 [Condylura cristata]|uniref:triggering receptor expressed on myeloid cells 1 n=1 Tax=Condylura cristata TaxID=143302 RepID=UPI00064392E5|nr:PREDICTED: triggering receptor expressed on myeloid cells 1 [Condylura cristata]
MGKARVRRLLWVFFLFISGLQVAASSEVTFIRAEGESLEVICPTNIWKHANSMKAWVRLDGAEARPLVFTEKPTGKPTQVQVERYFLEDVPTESILRVRMISLQQADSGLYQCVIYHPPKVSEVLFHPVRLVVTSNLQAEGQEVNQECLQEGENLTVTCSYNLQLYATSPKAWQRVTRQGPPVTLVRTSTRDPEHNVAQAGRYVLHDYPTQSVFKVTVTDLQRQDVGLYQCVIDLLPQNPTVLQPQIRLVQCKASEGQGSALALDLTSLPELATILTFGLILNKSIVFSVLFVFLRKA